MRCKMTFLVMLLIAAWMEPLHFPGQDNWNEVQYDLVGYSLSLGHVSPDGKWHCQCHHSLFWHYLKLWCIQWWKSVSFHCWTAMNLVGDMSSEENLPPTHHPLVIRSQELMWHEQWGGGPPSPTIPIGHQELRGELTWGGGPPPTYPHWSSGVESWSDMSNEEDPTPPTPIGHQELSWSDRSNEEEDLPPTYPLGHQESRVEVTWAIRRRTPIPHHPHWSSGIKRWIDMRRRTSTHLPPLVIRSWELKWHEQWGGPHPHWPSGVELKWQEQWGGGPTTHLPLWSSGSENWSDMSNEEECLHTETLGFG